MEEKDFINVRQLIRSKNAKLSKWLPIFVVRYLERILHQKELNMLIKRFDKYQGVEYCEHVSEYFRFQIEVEGLENIPLEGGATLAMNHPLGGMDGIALVVALKDRRTDLKYIVNDLLMNLKGMEPMFVGINKHGKLKADTFALIDKVYESNALVGIFPAGLVSRKIKGEIVDLEWKKTFVELSVKHDKPIIPIYIDGKLSNFFYRLSKFRKFLGIKANIEMLYLADEFFSHKGKKVKIVIGKPIQISELDTTLSTKVLASQVKAEVYKLAKK